MQLRFVTGLKITELSAFIETFVKGRQLDDHFTAYCRLSNGARGLVRASQIAIGHKNDLCLEVNGTSGTLTWRAGRAGKRHRAAAGSAGSGRTGEGRLPAKDDFLGEESRLAAAGADHPQRSRRRHSMMPSPGCTASSRTTCVRITMASPSPATAAATPASQDGVKHMQFVEAAVKSAKANSKPVAM